MTANTWNSEPLCKDFAFVDLAAEMLAEESASDVHAADADVASETAETIAVEAYPLSSYCGEPSLKAQPIALERKNAGWRGPMASSAPVWRVSSRVTKANAQWTAGIPLFLAA